jgi:CO dehydrogenase nickel-insertion accessory protein CooC1
MGMDTEHVPARVVTAPAVAISDRERSRAMPSEEARTLVSRKIGVFGKGGSGKSTVTILLARALRSSGYEVVLVDADSTNVGLAAALGVETPQLTLLDSFGGMIFGGGAVTCPVDDPTLLAGAELCLAEIPQEMVARSPEGIYLLVAGKIGHLGPGAGCDGPISKIARDLRIVGNGKHPVTLLDFKAGFEDTARGVITGLDWAVVIVDPTVAAVQMAADLSRTVEQMRTGAVPATEHLESPTLAALARRLYRESRIRGVSSILNRVPDAVSEGLLRARLSAEGLDVLGVVPTDPAIGHAWLRGTTLEGKPVEKEIEDIARGLERAAAAVSSEMTVVA